MSKSHVLSDAVSIRLGTTDAALRNNRTGRTEKQQYNESQSDRRFCPLRCDAK